MTDPVPRILITFYSRGGRREELALACGVGAVQARGIIRLRRMPDPDRVSDPSEDSRLIERMKKEYVAPTAADVQWADALVFCGPEGTSSGWESYLGMLEELRGPITFDDKVAAVIAVPGGAGHSDRTSAHTCTAKLLDLGLIAVPAETRPDSDLDDHVNEARNLGRRIAAVARSIRREA